MYQTLFKAPHKLAESIGGFCRSRWGVPSFEQVGKDMHEWFRSPLGQALLQEEKLAIDDVVQNQFGYFLLHLGLQDCHSLTEASRISHRFCLHPHLFEGARPGALADFHQLPLPDDTLDMVLLHHSLEFSQYPHQMLREASRVLIPRGLLVILVFNPWSFWGLFGRIMRIFTRKTLWRHQYLSQSRLVDWLHLLEMEPVSVYRGYFRPPFGGSSLTRHLQWMEPWGRKWGRWLRLPRGSFYMLVARKDRIPLTLIRPRWQTEKPLESVVATRSIPPLPKTPHKKTKTDNS